MSRRSRVGTAITWNVLYGSHQVELEVAGSRPLIPGDYDADDDVTRRIMCGGDDFDPNVLAAEMAIKMAKSTRTTTRRGELTWAKLRAAAWVQAECRCSRASDHIVAHACGGLFVSATTPGKIENLENSSGLLKNTSFRQPLA